MLPYSECDWLHAWAAADTRLDSSHFSVRIKKESVEAATTPPRFLMLKQTAIACILEGLECAPS